MMPQSLKDKLQKGVIFLESIPKEEQTEEIQLLCINLCYRNLEYCVNPSDKVIEAAIKINHNAAFDIPYERLTEKMHLMILEQVGPFNGVRCENPTKKYQIAALKKNGYYLFSIKNPTRSMIKIALANDGGVINEIHNPDKELINIALKSKWSSECFSYRGKIFSKLYNKLGYDSWNKPKDVLKYVNNCKNQKLKELFVKNNPYLAKYITNITPNMVKIAVKSRPNIIKELPKKYVFKEILDLAIDTDPRSILVIENPSEEMKLKAIAKDPEIVFNFSDLSEKEIQLFKKIMIKKYKKNNLTLNKSLQKAADKTLKDIVNQHIQKNEMLIKKLTNIDSSYDVINICKFNLLSKICLI